MIMWQPSMTKFWKGNFQAINLCLLSMLIKSSQKQYGNVVKTFDYQQRYRFDDFLAFNPSFAKWFIRGQLLDGEFESIACLRKTIKGI